MAIRVAVRAPGRNSGNVSGKGAGGFRGSEQASRIPGRQGRHSWATQILDRAYGRPVQSIDANITEDGGPVRYYAELPKKAESPEAWLQSLGKGQALPIRTRLTDDFEGDADDEQRH